MTAQEIKKLREATGLSRERFAQKIGVSAGSVYNWENGLSSPVFLALEQLTLIKEKINGQNGTKK